MILEILNSYKLHLEFLRRLVSDLDQDQMVCQPENVPNHPAWTIGHLVHSCEQIGGEIGIPPWLPADWAQRFGTGSTPVADPMAYPEKDALLRALCDAEERLTARLRAMGGLGLQEPLPDVRYRDCFPTLGHAVIHILAGHTALHLGQITVWRRLMRFPVVPEPLMERNTFMPGEAADRRITSVATTNGNGNPQAVSTAYKIAVVNEPTEAEREAINSVLREHNRKSNLAFWGALDDPANAARPLSIVARFGEGIVGGLLGETRFLWLKIGILSVVERLQRQGIGSLILAAAESEAVRRGCKYAYVETMEHQSPVFYQRLGYQVVGQLDNWDSHGHSKYILTKSLWHGDDLGISV